MTETRQILADAFPGLSEEQNGRFDALEELYRQWNAKINVISRKDMDAFFSHHVLHSLAIAKYINDFLPQTRERLCDGSLTVLDLGTGGGFPGIPLAILFPRTHFTLCDSVGKKTIVASQVSRALGLQNVEVVNTRAENLPGPFDYIVSRAVTSLDNFYPWVKGKFTEGILYLKGGDCTEEISKMISHNRLRKDCVNVWKVDRWLCQEALQGYFDGKLVIHIEK